MTAESGFETVVEHLRDVIDKHGPLRPTLVADFLAATEHNGQLSGAQLHEVVELLTSLNDVSLAEWASRLAIHQFRTEGDRARLGIALLNHSGLAYEATGVKDDSELVEAIALLRAITPSPRALGIAVAEAAKRRLERGDATDVAELLDEADSCAQSPRDAALLAHVEWLRARNCRLDSDEGAHRSHLAKARSLADESQDPEMQLVCALSLANLARHESGFRAAFDQLVGVNLSDIHDRTLFLSFYLTFASLLSDESGYLDLADVLLQQAKLIAASWGFRGLRARIDLSLANVKMRKGEWSAAEELTAGSRDLLHSVGDRAEWALFRGAVEAQRLYREDRIARARDLFDEAVHLYQQLEDDERVAEALVARGQADLSLGEFGRADAAFADAQVLFRTLRHTAETARAARLRCIAALARGNPADGRGFLLEAREILGAGAPADALAELDAVEARLLSAEGDWDAAFDLAMTAAVSFLAVGAHTSLDRGLRIDAAKGCFRIALAATVESYLAARTDEVEAMWLARAEELLVGQAAFVLGPLFASRPSEEVSAGPAEPGGEAWRIDLGDALDSAEHKVGDRYTATISRLLSLDTTRQARSSSRWALTQGSQGLAALDEYGTRDLIRRTKAILAAYRAAVVELVLLPTGYYQAFVLRPDGEFGMKQLEVTDAYITNLVIRPGETYQHALDESLPVRGSDNWLGELYERLWWPLEDSGLLEDCEHVFLAPEGAMGLVPFAALWSTAGGSRRDFLFQRRSLSNVSGIAALPMLADSVRRASLSRSKAPLAVVNPSGEVHPHWEAIGRRISDALEPQWECLREPASGGDLLGRFAGRPGVALIGHATFRGFETADGPLTAPELYLEGSLSGPVFLGACLIGADYARANRHGADFVTALHVAGAPAVCAPLWRIRASLASAVVVPFCRALSDREPLAWATALRATQTELMREPLADIGQWGAFTLFGLPGPLPDE
jgi:CHAT domain-containing protein